MQSSVLGIGLLDAWGIFTSVVLPGGIGILLVSIVGYLINWHGRKKLEQLYSYMLAFSSLGVATGIAIGNNRDPILGVVLPALLALVSALVSYMFTRQGMDTMRPAIPGCIAVISIGALIGLSIGSTTRKYYEFNMRKTERAVTHYNEVVLPSEVARYQAELELWKKGEMLNLEKELASAKKEGD